MPEVTDFTNRHGACSEGARFAAQFDTMADVWDNCPNANWMLWILARLEQPLDDKTARLFACWCVRGTPIGGGRKVWDLLTDPRSRKAVEVAERFAVGEATDDERRQSRSDAADAAYAYAAYAADAAAAARAAYAAAAARAAYAADAAAYAARAARKAQADQLRTVCPNPFRK